MYKQILYLLFVLIFTNQLKAQSDSIEIQQSGYFLTFIKKVYLNPTVYLRTQDFKERTNLSFVALPDLASDKTNASSGFEKGLQKVLRFLMQSDGGVRFYFNPDSTTHPFRFWYSEELSCKFKQTDKDSINYYLNHNFSDGNISMTNALRFETTIDKTLDYIEKCLVANPQECGDEPQNETKEINTKPLSITLHNRVNSKYDIDEKQFEKLSSHYAYATDIHTQQIWYAPSKLLVPNESNEPLAIAIHSNEGDFLKQNIKIEILKTHALLPIEQSSTEDSLFFSLPSSLPAGDPIEVIVKYKSPKDSNTYTVGFFMVNVMEKQLKNLVLVPVHNYEITENFINSVSDELLKTYGQASVQFNVSVDNSIKQIQDYPRVVEIQKSGILSNYTADLRDYVGEVQNLEDYTDENLYLVIGLETSELQGYMPRARNIGFIFTNAVNKPKVIAHEIGHGAFHFRHIFSEEELGEESEGTTENIMDYTSNPEDLYLHQWNFIKDPAFVSWFGGDDEDAEAKLQQKTLLFTIDEYELVHTTISNQADVDGFYTPSGFAVSFADPNAANWELKDVKFDKYGGGVSSFVLNNIKYTPLYQFSENGEYVFHFYMKATDFDLAKQDYVKWQIDEEKDPIDYNNVSSWYLKRWIKEHKTTHQCVPNLKVSDPGDNLIMQFFSNDCKEYNAIVPRVVLGTFAYNPGPFWENNIYKAPTYGVRSPFYLEKIYTDTSYGLLNFFATRNILLLENTEGNELVCEYRKILEKKGFGSRFLEKFNFNSNFTAQLNPAFNNTGAIDYQRAKTFLKIARTYDILDSNIISKMNDPQLRERFERIISYKFSYTGIQLTSLEQAEIYFNLLLKVQSEVDSYLKAIGNTKDEDYITYLVTNLLDDNDLAKLSLEDRISAIKCLVSDWMYGGEESAALRILNTAQNDQSTKILDELMESRTIYSSTLGAAFTYPNIFTALFKRITGAENKMYIEVLFKLWVFSEYNNSSHPKFSYENKPLVYDYRSEKILGFYDSNYNFDKKDDFSWISITKEIPSATLNGTYGSPFIGLVVDCYNEVTSTEKTYFYHPFQPIGILSVDQEGENIQLPDARVPAFLLYTFDKVNTNQNVRFAGEIALDIVTTLVGVPPFLTAIKGGFTAFKQLSRFRKLVLGVKTLEFTSGAANIILKYACDENNTTCQSVQSFLTYLEIACLSGDAIYGSIVKIKAKKLLAENMDQVRQMENADEIEELIRKSADDFANAGLNFPKYLMKAVAASPELANKISGVVFKSGDNFIDVIIHSDAAGNFLIKAEGKAQQVLGKDELAAIMSNLPAGKKVRLLSCNDEAAAKELSQMLGDKPFYASDGWVDIYQGGQVYSKNKFYKYQNGVKKTNESLPHNSSASSGLVDKVRMGLNAGDEVFGTIVRNGNKIEYTNPAGKVLTWTEQYPSSIDQSILSALGKPITDGKYIEGKVANMIKSEGKTIEAFGMIIKRADGQVAGDIDVLTKNEIIEVKKSFSSWTDKKLQTNKFVQTSNADFFNPANKKAILYIDEQLTEIQKTEILSTISNEVQLVNSLEELKLILK